MKRLKNIKSNSIKLSTLLLLFVCSFYIGSSEVSAAKVIFHGHTSIVSQDCDSNSILDCISDFDMDDDDDLSSEHDFVLPSSEIVFKLNSTPSPTLLAAFPFLPFKSVPMHILNGLIRI